MSEFPSVHHKNLIKRDESKGVVVLEINIELEIAEPTMLPLEL